MTNHSALEKRIQQEIETIRCGFCTNELLHSENANIVKIPDREFKKEACHGVLCDDCFQNKREPKQAILFVAGPNMDKIAYVDINDDMILSPSLKKKMEGVQEILTEKAEKNETVPSTPTTVMDLVENNPKVENKEDITAKPSGPTKKK